jgi:hypothetical protein
MTDEEAVLDGISDVPWAARRGRTYALTRDVSLARLTICEGVTLTSDASDRFILDCGEIVNRGTIHGTFEALGQVENDGYVDPASMRRLS